IQGSRITSSYRSQTYIGRAVALLGPASNSVIFFFAGPPNNDTTYAQLLDGLAASTSFLPARPMTAQPQPPTPSGLGQPWSSLLSDQALNYFSSYNSGGGGGGMASHRVLHLCSDGRFTFAGDSSIVMNVPGATGSSAGRSGFRGRWSLDS